jgi:hypothetical protein
MQYDLVIIKLLETGTTYTVKLAQSMSIDEIHELFVNQVEREIGIKTEILRLLST